MDTKGGWAKDSLAGGNSALMAGLPEEWLVYINVGATTCLVPVGTWRPAGGAWTVSGCMLTRWCACEWLGARWWSLVPL